MVPNNKQATDQKLEQKRMLKDAMSILLECAFEENNMNLYFRILNRINDIQIEQLKQGVN